MGRTIDQLVRNPNTTDGDNPLLGIVLRIVIVLTTLPVSIMVPFYNNKSLLMAFLGSFLETFTALIIPCVCFLSVRWGNIPQYQVVVCITVILLGLIAAGFGMEKSISEMVKAT